jgi:hypothetical protein
MMTRYMSLGLATLLSCAAIAGDTGTDTSATYTETGMRMADTRGNERRDDRGDDRDDRQDCRQDEGRVGGDKRDCKQDARGDDGDDA